MSHLARAARAFGLALLLTGLSGCLDTPTDGGRRSGEMRASLVSPHGAEGSAVLEVVSGEILDVASPGPFVRVYWGISNVRRVVVIRRDPGEIAFRLLARDVNDPPELRVLEVGGPDDVLRPSLSGYSVTVTRGGNP
ncbi:MAG: hypothetical protein KY453_08070 [Gemmatimonadetes bacterium]|nr:hypothetical protein [Gemmatimonadota bacterium]